MLSDFVKYVKQYWHDRPDKSTPLNADRLNHIENGIGSNSEAINQIANAVVSNIVNDPDKIASIAAVYALQEKLGTGELPSDASDAISAINTLYSNLESRITKFSENGTSMIFPCSNDSIYLVFDSHRGGINYMCFVIDTSATPHTYRLDNGEFGAVSIDPDTKIATITYCSFYHTGVIFKLI